MLRLPPPHNYDDYDYFDDDNCDNSYHYDHCRRRVTQEDAYSYKYNAATPVNYLFNCIVLWSTFILNCLASPDTVSFAVETCRGCSPDSRSKNGYEVIAEQRLFMATKPQSTQNSSHEASDETVGIRRVPAFRPLAL